MGRTAIKFGGGVHALVPPCLFCRYEIFVCGCFAETLKERLGLTLNFEAGRILGSASYVVKNMKSSFNFFFV